MRFGSFSLFGFVAFILSVILSACGQLQALSQSSEGASQPAGAAAGSVVIAEKPGFKLVRLYSADTGSVPYPSGQDIVIQVQGELLSGCYIPGPSAVELNPDRRQIIISQWQSKQPRICTQATVPAKFIIHLGSLQVGDYDLTSAEDGTVIGHIEVR